MNVFWIQDGKKICIAAMIFFPLGLFAIFTTDSPPSAALLGVMLAFFSILTFKGAEGWAWKRAGEKRRKKERSYRYMNN